MVQTSKLITYWEALKKKLKKTAIHLQISLVTIMPKNRVKTPMILTHHPKLVIIPPPAQQQITLLILQQRKYTMLMELKPLFPVHHLVTLTRVIQPTLAQEQQNAQYIVTYDYMIVLCINLIKV